MTGNSKSAECGVRIADSNHSVSSASFGPGFVKFRNLRSALRGRKGFSLLELMIAMFILIILLSIAMPVYQRSVQHAQETVLKENLWQMRKAIDQYAADKTKYPRSIDDLVDGKYLRERPIDPILQKDEWEEVQGTDPNSPDGEQGMVNVKSTAEGEDSDGTAYKDY